jgi:hypothetical protein
MGEPLRLSIDSACFAASADDGTVGLVIYTGATVDRQGYYEDAKGREQYGRYKLRLSLDPAHVRLDRLNSGAAPMLREHSQNVDAVIGQIVAGSAELGATLTARARLSDAPGDSDLTHKIRSGLVRNVSVGAFLHTITAEDLDATIPAFVATDWEPYEASAVAVGADPGARVALALDLVTPSAPPATEEHKTMSEKNAPATFSAEEIKTRNTAIRESARLLGLSGTMAVETMIDNAALTLDEARSALFAAKAAAADKIGIDGGSRVEVGEGDDTKRAATMGLALRARFGGAPLTDDAAPYAREYRFASIEDLARECLRRNGQTDAARLHKSAVIDAAMQLRTPGGVSAFLSGGGHTTGDFPLILADSARKSLRSGYNLNPGIHKRIARQRMLGDYLAHKHVLLGSTPNFSELPENGAPAYGPVAESGGSVILKDYASAVSVSRRALINDDLDALMGIPFRFGQSAMRKEAAVVLALLTGGTAGDWGDGSALFATAHGNIDATGAVPSIARVAAARLLMRLQTGVSHASQTAESLDIEPAFIIVPEAQVVTTRQLFAGLYTPTSAATANVPELFGGLQIVSDPILDAASSTRWFLSCDPNRFDGLEYCYLEGESGVVINSAPDWDTDGLKIKARMAFAAHAKDYRGLVTNAGA